MSDWRTHAAWVAPDLRSLERFTLLALCRRATADGRAWPGEAALAIDLGVTDRTIRTQLASLRERGLIDYVGRRREGQKIIAITVPTP